MYQKKYLNKFSPFSVALIRRSLLTLFFSEFINADPAQPMIFTFSNEIKRVACRYKSTFYVKVFDNSEAFRKHNENYSRVLVG